MRNRLFVPAVPLPRWGLQWARERVCDVDLDVGSFMWNFHRTMQLPELPAGPTVLSVIFGDMTTAQQWWLVVRDDTVNLCNEDPGYDVDVYITGTLEGLAGVWMGNVGLGDKSVILIGEGQLIRGREMVPQINGCRAGGKPIALGAGRSSG